MRCEEEKEGEEKWRNGEGAEDGVNKEGGTG